MPTVWRVWIRHMPCCMPVCAYVYDKNLCVCVSVCVCSGAARDTYILPNLTAGIPRFLEDDKFKGEAPADGIWERQDNAAGFRTWLGFRHHVTTVELGAIPKPFFTSGGISTLTRLNLALPEGRIMTGKCWQASVKQWEYLGRIRTKHRAWPSKKLGMCELNDTSSTAMVSFGKR